MVPPLCPRREDGSSSLTRERRVWFPSRSQEKSGRFPLSDPREEGMVPPLCPRRGEDCSPSLTQERDGWFPLSDPGEKRMVPLTVPGEECSVPPL